VSLVRALTCDAAFRVTLRAWADHVSLVSSYTPRILTSPDGSFRTEPKLTPAVRLNFVRLLVKCVSSYLPGENFILWYSAYLRYLLWIRSSVLQFDSVEIPYIRMLVLSAKPIAEILAFGWLQISRSLCV
jgi:hypothetical protein